MSRRARIRMIFRYPVKGLSPESLPRARLTAGETLPADRLYAIENGPSGFDPSAPAHFSKQRFLMLMRNERLARLKTRFDDATHVLSVTLEGTEVARGELSTSEGRAAIEQFLARFCADELRGPPKVLHGKGHSFSDAPRKVVSIINLASLAAIEQVIGVPVDPLRFRANLYVEGWPPWHEFSLLGGEAALGPSSRASIVERIVRCAATNVDPQTGVRDLAIPAALMKHFGHGDCGVYGQVVAGGEIALGDPVE